MKILQDRSRFFHGRSIIIGQSYIKCFSRLYCCSQCTHGQLHDRLQDEGISEELIKHVADRLGHDRRYGIDPTKIKNDLGWYPETPFEKGIVLTIDWYLNHEEWMNHVTSGDYQNYYQDMYKNK